MARDSIETDRPTQAGRAASGGPAHVHHTVPRGGFPPSRRLLPVGLLGMLALVTAIEATLSAHRDAITTHLACDWRRASEVAPVVARSRDVLCFGDSLVKDGMLPRVVQQRTGLRAYNLAVSAGKVPATYFLLRQALQSDPDARTKAIVVDFEPLMDSDAPIAAVRAYPELASVRDCFDLAWAARDANFLVATMLGKALPSYLRRHEIRARVRAGFDPSLTPPGPSVAFWSNLWKKSLGAQPMDPVPAIPPNIPTLLQDWTPPAWECDRLKAEYIDRFLALAESRKIPVFWLMPPLGDEIRNRRNQTGSDAAYDRFARSLLERHPNVVVLDARHSGYDDSVHADVIHLDRIGAAALSADVADVVADRLRGRSPGPRWVALPTRFGRTTTDIARSPDRPAR